MNGEKIRKIKEAVRNVIKEARELVLLDVKFESIKKVNNDYEVSGIYESKTLFGDVIESGEFEIILDENLDIISVKIKPIKERYR